MPLRPSSEPMDVLWLRLPHAASDPERAHGLYPGGDSLLVVMDRGDAWQIGYVFAKGAYQRLKQAVLCGRRAGRVERWYRPGLILIGDAAHVMSPVGGVGINYAVQDAIVTSNIVGPRLRHGTLCAADLRAIQRRRELPTRLMQLLQAQMRPRFAESGAVATRPPAALRWAMVATRRGFL
jgi:2-polyprenyl-6-methoxyphenol hydroxylase-like FAD-dependent oxidoreductase